MEKQEIKQEKVEPTTTTTSDETQPNQQEPTAVKDPLLNDFYSEVNNLIYSDLKNNNLFCIRSKTSRQKSSSQVPKSSWSDYFDPARLILISIRSTCSRSIRSLV